MKETPFRPPQPCPPPPGPCCCPQGCPLRLSPYRHRLPTPTCSGTTTGTGGTPAPWVGCLSPSAGPGKTEAAGSRVRQLRGQSQRRGGGERRTPSGRDRARGGWGGGLARARHGRGGAPGACPLEARRDWAWLHTMRVTYISVSLSWLWFSSPADRPRYGASGRVR